MGKKWAKKLTIQRFPERIKCPYCPEDADDFPSNLALARHVLTEHNWNKDFLKGFEVVEVVGSVMIVKEEVEKEDG